MPDATLEREAVRLFEDLLEVHEADRDAWMTRLAGERPELLSRLQALRDADRLAGLNTGAATETVEQEEAPKRIGAYRIVERIGRGGMGSVYRGERDTGDFAHVVAIKIIKPGLLSEALVERFQRERQLLARLSHPKIARLYDGGETEGGSPYMVMEYIDGLPLLRWVEENEPSRDTRLRLFGDICGAVGFAHRHLIVHRDLTPSNVLVTGEGQVKLIDFGIAKPADLETAREHGDGPASVATLSLTPGFAAPERMTSASVTTAADIYSLGRLLGKLIPPEPDDRELQAIVAKATAVDPTARYPTAEALAADVEAWHRGFPVDAFRSGKRYGARKFVSRHRFGVVAASAVLLILIGALTAALVANGRAQQARAEAEGRFEQTRAIAKAMLFQAYDEVSRVPGSTRARQTLASIAQSYLDALAADPNAPFDVRLEAGRGYKRLADVVGGPTGGSLGQRDRALANYARADAILTALHAEAPAHEEAALALADLRHMRAAVAVHIESDMEAGLRHARSIEDIVPAECADRDACAIARAQGKVVEGENLHWLERFDEAVTAFDAALVHVNALSAEARASEAGARLAARVHRHKGDSLYYLDDVAGAVRELRTASAILNGAIGRGIAGPAIERDLAIVEWSLGGSLDELGRPAEGVEALDSAYRLMQAQVAADSEDKGSLRLLAVVGGQRALTLSNAGRHREAIEGASAALAIRRRLSAQQPDESGYFRDVAIQLQALGDIAAGAGERARACGYYREAVEQFDQLDRRWGMTDFDRNDTYARARTALRSCA